MKFRVFLASFLVVLSSIVFFARTSSANTEDREQNVLVIQGKVIDSAGNFLSGARIVPFLNGSPFLPVVNENVPQKGYETGPDGLFRMEIPATENRIKSGKWGLKITRPSFKPFNLSRSNYLRWDIGKRRSPVDFQRGSVQLERMRSTVLDHSGCIYRNLCAHSLRDHTQDTRSDLRGSGPFNDNLYFRTF